jgi:hypothetical protein
MVYFIIYVIIGAVIGVLTWFWNSSQHKDCVNEGSILIYLFGCMFLWPAVLISTIIDIIKFITKEYCSQEI